MTVHLSRSLRVIAIALALPLLAATVCTSALARDKDTEKKKEKVQTWVEIRSPRFVVASDGGEKTARRVLDQFEQVVRVFQATMPHPRVSTGIPIQILAARNAQSFAKLFPEFPANSRRIQPAGLFITGPEKIFIGLRSNASGPVPFERTYQDYARMVLRLSYRRLPPWLEEGYINVYGSITLTDKGARLGRPDPEDMSVLYESPLLPLDIIFHVNSGSPYLSGGDKHTVFYAESHALVHYLLTDPKYSAARTLDQYIGLVEKGTDSLEAARQVFGNLDQLRNRLESYIKQIKPPPAELVATGGSDSGGSLRTLSPAEAEARLGALVAAHGRRENAQSKLEDALMQDPSLAEAEQSLGFLFLQHTQIVDAEKHFARALQLDPNNALTYYGQGLTALARGGPSAAPAAALAAFEKSVSLNPNFAPAWNSLASIYAQREQTMQKALQDAQRAAALDPGDSGYNLQVASIQSRLGRKEEARKAAAEVQASASDRKTAQQAGELLASMSQPAVPATKDSAEHSPVASAAEKTLRIENKTEPGDQPATAVSNAPRAAPAPTPPLFTAPPRTYSMIGRITDAICAYPPQVQITLKAQAIVMHLHANDLGKVPVKMAGSNAAVKNTRCTALIGHMARVSYLMSPGKPWDGEIQTVEFR